MTFPLRWGLEDGVRLPQPARLAHAHRRRRPSPTFVNYGGRTSIGAFGPLMAEQLDPDVGWSDVEGACAGNGAGRCVIKGLLHPDEAREAMNRGADAIIVSNHRRPPTRRRAVTSISALRKSSTRSAAGRRFLIDGGFRQRMNVIKALALGARAVLIGRPHLWGVTSPARKASRGCSSSSAARSIARSRSAAGTASPSSIRASSSADATGARTRPWRGEGLADDAPEARGWLAGAPIAGLSLA